MTTDNISKQVDFPAVIDAWGQTFVKVAKTIDIPVGKMMHVEVEGTEILIANVDGKFYAVGDRCPHLNAMLSKGTLNNSTVTCPRHFSSFDVITGKAISGQTQRGRAYDLPVYEVKVDGNDLFIYI
ncbi:MAG: non-heme iron oxygenase ferredoxin subunit [Candidatus Bathyarchaeia archaeon]|jgi:nitrite reductase/ring-hydroxylating ferredoxin subunit